MENLDAAFGDIDAGRVDSAAKQISITPPDRKNTNFSEPYFSAPIGWLFRSQTTEITKFEDLYGKKIALETVSAAHEYIKALDPEGKVEILTFPSDLTMLQEVEAGPCRRRPLRRAGLGLRDETVWPALETHRRSHLHRSQCFPLCQNRAGDRIRAEVDKALAEMKADGTLSEICIKWCWV